MDRNELNALSNRVIGAAIEVHRILGPGLLESTYQEALMEELELRGIQARKEVSVPFIYKGKQISKAYRADIIVEDAIILELKSTETDNPLFYKQLLTYLRLADKRLGLLMNFHHAMLSKGLTRVVNGF
ncbi:MAG: GxxExxY protein [Muribaculaceae bacterium]|nr:GxxExxY protein [Muribaculaceae bacterium]